MSPVMTVSPNAVNALRALLEAERDDTLANLGKLRRYSHYLRGQEQGARGAPRAGRKETLESEFHLLQEHLAAVEQARSRAEEGTYGVCLDCGDPIPFSRLLLVPWAPRDLECELLRGLAA